MRQNGVWSGMFRGKVDPFYYPSIVWFFFFIFFSIQFYNCGTLMLSTSLFISSLKNLFCCVFISFFILQKSCPVLAVWDLKCFVCNVLQFQLSVRKISNSWACPWCENIKQQKFLKLQLWWMQAGSNKLWGPTPLHFSRYYFTCNFDSLTGYPSL